MNNRRVPQTLPHDTGYAPESIFWTERWLVTDRDLIGERATRLTHPSFPFRDARSYGLERR